MNIFTQNILETNANSSSAEELDSHEGNLATRLIGDINTKLGKNNSCYNKTVSESFEQCVFAHGERVAARFGTRSLTYNELNTKANRFAHYLRQCGVQTNTFVAVYLERSLEFVIAILAIVKAGGAYVPLDVDIPLNKNFAILKDSNPCKIIVCGKNGDTFYRAFTDDEMRNKIIDLDNLSPENSNAESCNLAGVNNPNDLLYVMYTSGSTGMPKGCMIPHQGVIALVKNINYVKINKTDCFALSSNTAFDASTFEIWGALLNGATLVIAPKSIFYDANLLTDFLVENHITILWVSTSIFHLLVEKHPAIFNCLKYLLVGGDVVYSSAVNTILKQNIDNLTIIIVYGPTECTTFSTFYNIPSSSEVNDPIPIGKPLSGKTYLILDDDLRPVSDGKVGELCIAGLGLAKGYLNQPKLTEEKFIFFNLGNENKLRLYRSGDYVKLLPDGNLQFIGRKDRQVKIRGYRVNLDEVEACIAKFPAIYQVAVIAEDSEKNGRYLIAYVNFHKTVSTDFGSFRQYLRHNLPNYMIPQKIISLDSMPLTSGGKFDRKILSQIQEQAILLDYEKPSSSIEQSIIEILAQLLETSTISSTENFFELGASSLMLGELCVALNAKLEQSEKISITDIFTYPSPRLLAQYILREKNQESTPLKNDFDRAILQKRLLLNKKGKRGMYNEQ